MPVTKNLYIDQGAYYSVSLPVVDSATGAPIDLTDYTITAQMAKYVGASSTYELPALIKTPIGGSSISKFPAQPLRCTHLARISTTLRSLTLQAKRLACSRASLSSDQE